MPSEELYNQANLRKISWEWEVGSSKPRIGLIHVRQHLVK